ncbi:hypothetical protein TTHERM_000694439 (macronuclear) [Tetrahymena thermophila SB210]|uniref:Uncharacterized protein n=1 Tax=Tetrahymena thermophila (strain SB210) TaxID=312017 RepID=W7XE07_TETTS|nr:hypothetical protein TTHERM_000694439 [Tetrahymena thermophila SB210]EWS72161.1 hypothetical protein TTHERM_000694439 [Tetrahymena thermophila SB210]|eukprot:XP_012655292.1 hypothetical protein TTHERM_000694439 [Tetrahymena thermophila SB210]
MKLSLKRAFYLDKICQIKNLKKNQMIQLHLVLNTNSNDAANQQNKQNPFNNF